MKDDAAFAFPDDKLTAPDSESRTWPALGALCDSAGRRSKDSGQDAAAGLQALLDIEQQAREAGSASDLLYLLANATQRMTGARQVFVFETVGKPRLVNISGIPAVNRSAPLVRAAEDIVNDIGKTDRLRDGGHFTFSEDDIAKPDAFASYPYSAMWWCRLPCPDKKKPSHGLLLFGERKLSDHDIVVAKRLAGTVAHALRALDVKPSRLSSFLDIRMRSRRIAILSLILMLATLGIPVSMTALATMEVMPADPFIVAAPLAGVIEDVLIAPNEHVEIGQPVVRLEATEMRNRLEIAEEEVLIAKARLRQAGQRAFDHREARHELSIAQANHDLKVAELTFAQEEFDRTTVTAARSGTAIFADRQELLGKPVVIGERIMKIADPNRMKLSLYVDVSDMMTLASDGKVKVFFDSDPINARDAVIASADYQARTMPDGTMAFRLLAELSESTEAPPRLGARGTAQIYGERVPLGFYLFRRPLSAFRQWIGI